MFKGKDFLLGLFVKMCDIGIWVSYIDMKVLFIILRLWLILIKKRKKVKWINFLSVC